MAGDDMERVFREGRANRKKQEETLLVSVKRGLF
jgi:hypothetical protein